MSYRYAHGMLWNARGTLVSVPSSMSCLPLETCAAQVKQLVGDTKLDRKTVLAWLKERALREGCV